MKNHISQYLARKIPLQELEKQLLANLQDILDSGDEAAIHLANELDADLMELGEGLINEAEFKSRTEQRFSRVPS